MAPSDLAAYTELGLAFTGVVFIAVQVGRLINSFLRGHRATVEVHEDTAKALREALEMREFAHRTREADFKTRMKDLADQVEERTSALREQGAGLSAAEASFHTLYAFCELANQFLEDLAGERYAAAMQDAEHVADAFVEAGKGGEARFNEIFAAGRGGGPVPPKGMARLLYHAAAQHDKLVLITLIADIAVKTPMGMYEEYRQDPDAEFHDLFTRWFESSGPTWATSESEQYAGGNSSGDPSGDSAPENHAASEKEDKSEGSGVESPESASRLSDRQSEERENEKQGGDGLAH